jgi:hypothetical protein
MPPNDDITAAAGACTGAPLSAARRPFTDRLAGPSLALLWG